MSKLEVNRDGRNLALRVFVDAAGGKFTCHFDAGSEWAATLLAQAVRDVLGRQMKVAREEAYREGWKDKAAKRAKASWFSTRLP